MSVTRGHRGEVSIYPESTKTDLRELKTPETSDEN